MCSATRSTASSPTSTAGKVRPVHLRLRPGRRLDPPPRPDRRRRVGAPPVPLHRAQAAVIAMLPPQPVVQRRQIDAAAVLLRAPVLDRRREGLRLRPLPRPPVHRPGRHPPGMVAHRAFRHAQKPGDLALRRSPRRQRLDRHARLRVEPAHPSPPGAPCAGSGSQPEATPRKSGCRLSRSLACRRTRHAVRQPRDPHSERQEDGGLCCGPTIALAA